MSKTKIMIVEDEEVSAAQLQHRLHKLGYFVSAVVSSGEAAIEQAIALHPDLVLLDIVLAGQLDGVETAQQIQTQFNIPVVYLTAQNDPETLRRSKMTESYGYIFKPFTDRELFGVIETALHRHRVEQQLTSSKQRETLAYELGQQLTILLEPTELLTQTVNHLKESFGYYHAQVYLLSEQMNEQGAKETLLYIEAGTGKAGAALLQGQHHIPLKAERSLVARAARSQKAVVVNDIRENPYHLPNPLLPDTRSEVAMPLVLGERLLGVLDVQDSHLNHFNAEEIRTLQIVANQLAIAISNAQLFADNARRSAIIENSADFIALISPQEGHKIVYANSAGARLVGYQQPDELVGLSMNNICPIHIPQTEQLWREENLLQRCDKKTISVDQTTFIIPHKTPEKQLLATIITDITQRKQTDEALHRYAERLKILREIDHAILMVQSPQDIAVAAITQIQKLIPCLRATVFSFDAIHQEATLLAQQGEPRATSNLSISLNEFTEATETLQAGQIYTLRNFDALPNAPVVNEILQTYGLEVYFCVPLIAQNKLIGALNLGFTQAEDFTPEHMEIAHEVADVLALAIQQARQHQALHEAENRYHSLFNNTPVGLYRTTPTGQILEANIALAEMLGYPSREALMTINVIHSYVSHTERDSWLKAINDNNFVNNFELRLRRRDGTIIWARNSARVIRDEQGQILYFEGALVS